MPRSTFDELKHAETVLSELNDICHEFLMGDGHLNSMLYAKERAVCVCKILGNI